MRIGAGAYSMRGAWGLGVWLWSLGFRVQVSGLRLQSFGSRGEG